MLGGFSLLSALIRLPPGFIAVASSNQIDAVQIAAQQGFSSSTEAV